MIMSTSTASRKKPIKSSNGKKSSDKGDISASYNKFKKFEGKQYTGMAVGRSHKWYYDQGVWKEKKITPDLWEISYSVTKRRAGKAPEGSGVPLGTEYHWYIISHQNVKKINANDYTTTMSGLKYKLAHKRAGKDKWSATAKTQRKHLIKFLQEFIAQLKKEPVPLQIEYDGKTYKGEAVPIPETCHDGVCPELDITLNDEHLGILHNMKSGWKMEEVQDQKLIDAIGQEVLLWYE
jgi:hypothetical protein